MEKVVARTQKVVMSGQKSSATCDGGRAGVTGGGCSLSPTTAIAQRGRHAQPMRIPTKTASQRDADHPWLGELEGDLANQAAPSSSSSAAGDDDDDDPFLSAGFISTFSAFSRERKREGGRERERKRRWWGRRRRQRDRLASRRHGRSVRRLPGAREKKDGDGGGAIGWMRIWVDKDEKAWTSFFV
uniref:Uncharacterized protein n=1 Tax=Oryza sativa subsp. japonica TaxID=39947 RepID=Q6ZL27_ORYSJ|nr:hypothetical protein [Oryza sativa Japonica Group]BAD31873.1 hypothetical protein [Oryza sativa Japonica Group]